MGTRSTLWVAITMEILSDYFEVIDYTPYSSMVYRLKSEIPAQLLEKCMSANITKDEMEHYYLRFLERFRPPRVPIHRVMRVLQEVRTLLARQPIGVHAAKTPLAGSWPSPPPAWRAPCPA